jgi:hypothetical protein
MVDLSLMLPKDLENSSLEKAQVPGRKCSRTFCLPIHARGHQDVDAWGRNLLYALWKAFAFTFYVFQLHFLLFQFFTPLVVIIFGTSRIFIFSIT